MILKHDDDPTMQNILLSRTIVMIRLELTYQVFHNFPKNVTWMSFNITAPSLQWVCLCFLNENHSESVPLFFIDSEIPVISGTPSTQNVNTDDDSPTAIVSWTPPTASDNSGETVTLTADYGPGDTFPIGTTTVTYTATDAYGNTATSTLNVVVIGKYDSQLVKSKK